MHEMMDEKVEHSFKMQGNKKKQRQRGNSEMAYFFVLTYTNPPLYLHYHTKNTNLTKLITVYCSLLTRKLFHNQTCFQLLQTLDAVPERLQSNTH